MKSPSRQTPARRFWHHNGLSLVLFGLALLTLVGQTLAGWRDYNDDLRAHHQAQVPLTGYLGCDHFWEALSENWESEFLQMGAFVLLTCFLYQKGSPESKDPEEEHPSDEAPAAGRGRSDAPWPVHRGGWVLWLYSRSLTFMFFWLFAMCFFLHAVSGAGEYNREQALIGEPGTTWLGYLATAQFWFESFQNWQSEFLSLGAFVVLSVYLRQRGSAESKAVSSSHDVHE